MSCERSGLDLDCRRRLSEDEISVKLCCASEVEKKIFVIT